MLELLLDFSFFPKENIALVEIRMADTAKLFHMNVT